MLELVDKLAREHALSQDEYAMLIDGRTPALADELAGRAREACEAVYGNAVFARGLIEFTNICKNDCYYCGIRRSNGACERYRLTREQILACADAGWRAGFRTFVLQGGEDPAVTDEWLAELIGALKAAHPGCAVTLSVGERSRESYWLLRAAGADRYLLRHETATAAHYRQLHPAAMTLQRRPAPDARTFIGEGKAEEVKALAEANDASLILFDNELSPSQMSNLEELTGRTVLDRSALILDIFAQRARTGEGKLQVELAQYQYILPRLAGMGKAMSRLGGGIGTRGPGESKLESDRRHIRSRIDKLRRDLEQVRQVRAVQRRQRKKTELPMVAIVGYTNAGKSTLLNTLTGAGIEANDRLFDTLDPTTRKKRISDTQEILLSDTVGFIRKLPHHLVSAFKATLEELAYADLLLHVVDVSDEDWQVQAETVDRVIAQLGAQDIPRLMVYNKADKCDPDVIPFFRPDEGVKISAKTGEGVDALLAAIEKALGKGKHRVRLCIPYSDGAVLDMLHREAQIESTDYAAEGTIVEAVVDDKTCGRVEKYIVENNEQ